MRLPLLALAIASFGIGTTEFVIMGLLPEVATDLSISIPRAGLLVTGYALGVAVGAPVIAVATARLDRRLALLTLIALFIIGNLGCALAPNFWTLMAARVVTSLCHGAFFGLGSVVAADLVPRDRKTQAMAMMFAGLTLANVLGVPFGTLLGQAFGWRMTFAAVVVIGLAAATALSLWLPRNLPPGTGRIVREFSALRRPQVLLAMLISVCASASLFSVFTYIAPLLRQVTGLAPHDITLVLLVFGVGLTIGNFGGAKLGDWRLMPTLIGIFILLALTLAILTVTSHNVVPTVITLFVWGALAFALVSPLQMRVVTEAVGAPTLVSTLNQGAFNLGNASGAWIGGYAIDKGLGYGNLPWVGAALALLALGCTIYSHLRDRPKMGTSLTSEAGTY